MYNMSVLKEKKNLLIIIFGTLTNYGASKSCFKREKVCVGEGDVGWCGGNKRVEKDVGMERGEK